MSAVKIKRAETPDEAAEFGRTQTHYLRAGLCDRCAAQASYGHQHGWAAVHAPCPTCLPLVTTFPGQTRTTWRYLTKTERRNAQKVGARVSKVNRPGKSVAHLHAASSHAGEGEAQVQDVAA